MNFTLETKVSEIIQSNIDYTFEEENKSDLDFLIDDFQFIGLNKDTIEVNKNEFTLIKVSDGYLFISNTDNDVMKCRIVSGNYASQSISLPKRVTYLNYTRIDKDTYIMNVIIHV